MKTVQQDYINSGFFLNLNTIWLNAKALAETADLLYDYSLCLAEEP